MKKKINRGIKRALAITMAASMAMSALSFSAMADEASATTEESDPYIYYYNGYDINVSPHFIGETEHWTMIFRLDTEWLDRKYNAENLEKEGVAAYCCDITTELERGEDYAYKRINLEDASYYDDKAAGYIRGIFSNGYWPGKDWDLEKAQKKANKWLEKEYPGKELEVHSMSNAEALTATQAAIWHFANDKSAEDLEYSATKDEEYMSFYCDNTTVDKVSVSYTEGSRETTKGNINLFTEYLINQRSQLPEDVIFTDNHFISEELFFVSEAENSVNCNGSLYFKLDGTIGKNDDLTLQVQVGDRECMEYPLVGRNALKPDDNGYYKIEINNITEDEALEDIEISITGYQMVDGVYFYEVKPSGEESAQKTSQNLVGYYKGKNDISVTTSATIDMGTTSVSMYKYDGDAEVDADSNGVKVENGSTVKYYEPLSDAVFSLYAKVDDEYFVVREGLKSDENGYIQVDGLIDKYEYFFVETDAPDGYELNGEWYSVYTGSNAEKPALIVNHTKATEPETTPAETTPEETTPEETTPQETTPAETTSGRHNNDDDEPRTTAPTTTAAETTAPETTAPVSTVPETVAPETVVYRGVEIPKEILDQYPDKTLDELYDMGVLGEYFEKVPTGLLPATSDATIIWTALSVLSGLGLAGTCVIGRRREDEE